MSRNLTRKPGAARRRGIARTTLAAVLAVSLALPAIGALAEEEVATPDPGARYDTGGLAALAEIDPGKLDIFRRPTPADPREELACLALNIYFEARGEPEEGKLAVGHVVMNRVASARFPDTICDVIRQGGEVRRNRCQFSWWCDGRSDKPRNRREWHKSSEVALSIYWGRSDDPTAGALWYHADYVKPAWRRDFVRGPKIGRHIFYLARQKQARLTGGIIR